MPSITRRCPRCGGKIVERICRGCRDRDAVRRQRRRRVDEPAEITIEMIDADHERRYRELLQQRLAIVEARQADSAASEHTLRRICGLIDEQEDG